MADHDHWDDERSRRGPWDRDPGRGQTFGREYGARDDFARRDQQYGGQGGQDMAGRNLTGQGWSDQGGQPRGAWQARSNEGGAGWADAGRFGQDLGRRGMTSGQSLREDEGRDSYRESMFGPDGLGADGFGSSLFSFGRRRRREDEGRSFAGGQSHRGRGPRGYQRSDERIREDINERLTYDDHLDASDIDVEVRDCEVSLNGAVRSREEKHRAEDIAEEVSGVRHVQNNLRVDRGGPGFSSTAGARSGV